MSRIEDIFLLARDTLNDHKKQRWSDDTLMRNLRMGIKDIAKQTRLFKDIVVVPLKSGTGTYILPDGILSLSHVTFKKKLLPLVTSGFMTANYRIDWKTESVELPEGDLETAIFDEVKRKELAVYPRPYGDMLQYYDSGPYGLVGGITDYLQDSEYGLVADLIDLDVDETVQTSFYGVISVLANQGSLTVYFCECPPLPETIEDDLQLDECFDPALKFYICGIALRNDLDVVNRQIASEEFTLYEREITVIYDLAVTDSVDAPWFESPYNPIG
jgi:hypothetical protein